MLWDILWRYKNTISLTFCLSFSTLCMLWQTNPFSKGVAFFGKASDRLSGALNSSLRLPGTIWVELDKYRELEEKYAHAQSQIEQYRLEKDKFDILQRENDRLRNALGFAPNQDFPEVRAEVLGIRVNSISPRIIIGKGREDGLAPFMPVITRVHDSENNIIRCVVGIVASVDSNTAVVEPLIHPGFRLGVRMPEGSQWAIMSGNSGRVTEVLLTYLTTDSAPETATLSNAEVLIKPGLKVYTSGDGGIFPPGLPVGELTREGPRQGEFRTAYMRPYAPISTLDFVSVVLRPPAAWAEKWERDSNWEEHLQTEFGEPQYPDTPRRSRQAAPQTPIPAQEQEKEPGEVRPPENQPTGPRRIQNVQVPSPGNR